MCRFSLRPSKCSSKGLVDTPEVRAEPARGAVLQTSGHRPVQLQIIIRLDMLETHQILFFTVNYTVFCKN